MSAFNEPFLFLRDPRGGVEDIAAMRAAGYTSVFCNVGDHDQGEWQTIRGRAGAAGVRCGPWMRVERNGEFSSDKLYALIAIADLWEAPLIVNAEAELKGSGATLTQLIVDACGTREAALSMEPWPFDDVEWWPLGQKMPVLPQVFGALGWYDPTVVRDQWWAYGVACCFPTFGTYGDVVPADYPLKAPYSLYTADDCGGDYLTWAPTGGGYVGCVDQPKPPDGGDDMQVIGEQDGVVAEYNALRDLDSSRTLLKKVEDPNKPGKMVWEDISVLDERGIPVADWKGWDKAQRRAQILVDDHDEAVNRELRQKAGAPKEPPAV